MGDEVKTGLRHLMPALVSGAAAFVTAIAGLLGALHQMGYLTSSSSAVTTVPAQQSVAIQPPAAIPGITQPLAPMPGAVQPRQRLPQAGLANVDGAWRDGASNCHLIQQNGNRLVVTTYLAKNNARIVGRGVVNGRRVHVKMNNRNPLSPVLDFFLSNDGQELAGMLQFEYKKHPALWSYIGANCTSVSAGG